MKNGNDQYSSNLDTKKQRKFEILQAEILRFQLPRNTTETEKGDHNIYFENSKILKFQSTSRPHLTLISNKNSDERRRGHLFLVE